MVLDTSLLNTRQCKVISRVKWSNPGKGVAPSSITRCSSYWKKGAFWSPFTLVANFTYIYIYIYIIVMLIERSLLTPSFFICPYRSSSLQVLLTTSRVRAELMFVSLCLSAKTGVSMRRSPWNPVANEFPLYFISSAWNVSFFPLGWPVRWEVGGCTDAVFRSATFMIYSKQHVVVFCSSHVSLSVCLPSL